MAETTKRTLEVEVRTKDLATKSLDRVGAAGEKAGARVARGMKKADASAKEAKGSILELGKAGTKAAGVAGSAFASVGAAASLATANMDSLAGSAAGAAGSIAAGFAAGGPVGGALALASAGVGALIFAFRQSGEAARDAGKEAADAYGQAAEKVRAAAGAVAELRQSSEFALQIAKRQAAGENVDVEKETRKVEIRRALNEARKDEIVLVERANALLKAANELDADDDDERAVATREAAAKVLEDVNSARQRSIDLIRVWKAENEIDALEKVTAARKADAEALKKAAEAAKKAAEARRALAAAISKEVEGREMALRFSGEELTLKKAQVRADELRTKGLDEAADALERVARAEFDAARATKARGEAQKKAQAAQKTATNVAGFGIRARAAGTKNPVQALLIRQEAELLRFAGAREEKEALLSAHKAEQVALAKEIASSANEELDAKRAAVDEYVEGLTQGNELLKAEIDGTREALELRTRLAEAAKEGGRAAVLAMKEQIVLERQILEAEKQRTQESEKRAAKESEIARIAGGGNVDKGLASRRNRRRAKLHLKKRARELRNRRSIRSASGPFGIVTEESEDGIGSPSVWGGGQTAAQKEAEDERRRRATGGATGGDGDVNSAAAEALKGLAETTGEGRKTAEQILEQAKANVTEAKKRNEADGKTAELSREAKTLLEEAAKIGADLESLEQEKVKATESLRDAMKGQEVALTSAAVAMAGVSSQVDANSRAIQRLLDAASLLGGN